MLTRHELKLILDDIEYKPGWELRLEPGDYMSAKLVITLNADDSRRPGHDVSIRAQHVVYPEMFSHEAEFIRFVRYKILEAEIHEVDEFLRYKGALVNDPHARDA